MKFSMEIEPMSPPSRLSYASWNGSTERHAAQQAQAVSGRTSERRLREDAPGSRSQAGHHPGWRRDLHLVPHGRAEGERKGHLEPLCCENREGPCRTGETDCRRATEGPLQDGALSRSHSGPPSPGGRSLRDGGEAYGQRGALGLAPEARPGAVAGSQRRRLPAAHESDRRFRCRTLEEVHATDGSRGRISRAQERVGDPDALPSVGKTGEGTPAGCVSRLCAAGDPQTLAEAEWFGGLPGHRTETAVGASPCRHLAAHRRGARDLATTHHESR